MLHILGNTPENAGQVLKYLLMENRVELPGGDYTCVRRKKRRYFCKSSVRLFLSRNYLIFLET